MAVPLRCYGGKINLIGAEEYSISLNGNSLVELTIDKASLDAIVENHGAVIAAGGEIIIKAQAMNDVFKGVVNNTGIIEARSLDDITGKTLLAANGSVLNTGVIDVSNATGTGGEIRIIADSTLQHAGTLRAQGVDGGFIALASPNIIGEQLDVSSIGNGNAGWYYVGSAVEYVRAMQNPNISKSGTLSDRPILFNENLGQFGQGVSFAAWGNDYSVALSAADAAAYFGSTSGQTGIHFDNANENIHAVGLDEKSSYSNYYLDGQAVEHVRDYGGVRYSNVYDGIDLVYYTNAAGHLEHDLIVSANADASSIAYRYDNSDVTLTANGDLNIQGTGGTVTQKAPLVYQHTQKGRKIVASEYALDDNRANVVLLDEYDRNSDLIVDPVVLWSSTISGSSLEIAWDPVVDSSGVYVAGYTVSSGLSTDSTTFGGYGDGFIQKLSHAGDIAWTTYYGSSTFELISGLDVDSGKVYVSGITQSRSGLTGYTSSYNGYDVYDGFVSSFEAADGTLNWDRQIGGSHIELGLEVDAYDGHVYFAGITSSTSALDVDGQAVTGTDRAGRTLDSQDIFAGKFDSSGTLQWLQTIKRNNKDQVTALKVDATGYYLGGSTQGRGILDQSANAQPWDIATLNARSVRNGLLIKLGLDGSYGWARQIGVDELYVQDIELYKNSIYAVGVTSDSGLNTFGNNYAGQNDSFITQYSLDGTQNWLRYYGGTGTDSVSSIASTPNGVYIYGSTQSEGLDPSGQTFYDGVEANYLARFTDNGYLNWFKYQDGDATTFSFVTTFENDLYVLKNTRPFQTSDIVIQRHTEFPFESPELLVALVQETLDNLDSSVTRTDVLVALNNILGTTSPQGIDNSVIWEEFFKAHSEDLNELTGFTLLVPDDEEEGN